GQFDKDYVVAVEKLKIPLVCVDFYYDDLALDSIVSNNYNAGHIATKYLIHKGHQKIGFVGTVQATNSIMDRYLGYYKALIEKELPRSDAFVIDDRDRDGEMIDFKLPSDLPTAFLCNNDHVAYLLAEKLKSMSIHVPNDVSIIGFDDVIYSRISNPQITTMKVSRTYMAEQAIKLILRRIRSKDAKLINMTLECIM